MKMTTISSFVRQISLRIAARQAWACAKSFGGVRSFAAAAPIFNKLRAGERSVISGHTFNSQTLFRWVRTYGELSIKTNSIQPLQERQLQFISFRTRRQPSGQRTTA